MDTQKIAIGGGIILVLLLICSSLSSSAAGGGYYYYNKDRPSKLLQSTPIFELKNKYYISLIDKNAISRAVYTKKAEPVMIRNGYLFIVTKEDQFWIIYFASDKDKPNANKSSPEIIKSDGSLAENLTTIKNKTPIIAIDIGERVTLSNINKVVNSNTEIDITGTDPNPHITQAIKEL
jgi:hypothetical protein